MGTNTGLGIGIGIPFKNNALGGDKPYFPPELKARMIGVWTNYGKKNTDADRNIIKNKIPNAGGDLEILNAAYEGMSGYNGYPVIFGINKTWASKSNGYVTSITSNTIHITNVLNAGLALLYSYVKFNGKLQNIKEIPPFKIEIKGLEGKSKFIYKYLATSNATKETNLYLENGTHELPKSFLPTETLINDTVVGFSISNIEEGVTNFLSDITIKVLPEYEGAFVTDGVDDMITSTKTVQEMLGGSNEITVVSMMANLDSREILCNSNYSNTNGYNVRNTLEPNGVITMLGYTDKNGTTNNLNLIMGDKNSIKLVDKVNFNSDYVFYPAQYYKGYYQVAWYWTIIANKVLTTDQINQVIAYFNLDRTLKPDILCNITKQGITNDNHADFNDKLIDYSGNGRDIQMNNLAWKGGSGIAAKPFETIKDYTILSDEARQKLTIYNEFSYKVKSNTPNHYWIVQSIIKDNTSYQVTIITDKDCYWINSTSFTNNEGNKESIRKEYPVKANTPTQVTICGLNEFEYPEDIEPTTAVSYVNLNYAGEVTVTFIPSCKGGLLLDGVNDFGKVTGLPIYKDYTVVADRELFNAIGCVLSNDNPGAFIFETSSASVYSFGEATTSLTIPTDKQIKYQTKYSYNGQNISIGAVKEGTSNMWLGTIRDNDARFRSAAIYSLMTFPYSMSEFLIERQLKKHKLGTLYPNMVEFRPVIKANANYKITYYQIDSTNTWKSIKVGDYIVIGAKLAFQITFDNDASELKEVVSPQLSGIIVEKRPSNPGYNIYSYITSKSPQKINITIDEYIRYEDIVQPYPVIFQITDRNTNQRYSWGDKIKVGSSIRLSQGEKPNLLSGLYSIQSYEYEGETYSYNQLTNLNIILTKQSISLSCNKIWLLDDNEPKCILSPRLLRIPNSSYKILGYIPDISGHGNHGVIHNSAYAEGSGVNEDGSYQFDGVDDFVTIPTLSSGGKQVLMKVNWNTINSIIYDQRGSGGFAIYCSDYNNPSDSITVPAYKGRNAAGTTYIDGIRNEYIIASQLRNVTHNIVEILDTSYAAGNINPIIGKSNINANYGSLALYDFMLFDNISTDDKIKQLNEYVGIEAKVELPPYYWDAYGKTNLDADKATIQQRGVAVGDYDLINNNFAYEGMSGYNGYPAVFGTNKTYANLVPNDGNFILTSSHNIINVTKFDTSYGLLYSHIKLDGKLTSRNIDYPSYKIKVTGLGENFGLHYSYLKNPSDANLSAFGIGTDGTYTIPKSFASDGSLINNNVWIGFIFTGTAPESCNVTIEVLPEYENGLAYDGVSDFTDNKNIPILTDFTFIIKREILGLETNESMLVIKGDKVYNNGIGNAFILEHNSNGVNYVYSYGKLNQIKRDDSKIIYLTPESYNGNPIIKGENGDNLGLVLSRHWRGIIYKTILYSKTMSLLEINFLKNLMEKDEIIDLNNPIFIKMNK